MVKTRSSARVGGSAGSAAAGVGSTQASGVDRTRHRAGENAHRNQRTNNTMRQNQVTAAAVAAAAASPGGGGKDVSLPVLPVSRSLYQHPAVSAAYTHAAQDSRIMPVAPRQNSLYAQSVYQQFQQHAQNAALTPALNHSPQPGIPPYPVHPDVRLKRLPFYDMLAEIMKPSSLVPTSAQRIQEASFYFHLTPQQATDIATGKDLVAMSNKLEYIVQAQLRFCLLETSCEQEDCFPPSVTVKINGKMCPLPNPIPTNKPGVEPKRPPRPVNITTLLKLSPTVANTMTISWAADFTRGYALSVSMVRKLTSNELLQRLKNKGTKNPDYTRSLIKEKLAEDYDCEIATTSLRVSLVCPLGKMRMQCPCRPSACPHLQCFDASLFLQMNERKPTWLCPVCDRPASYDTLVVDGYFQDVLSSQRLPSECNEIQLLKDGSWSIHVTPAQTSAPLSPPRASAPANVQLISDDVEVIPLEASASSALVAGVKRAAVADADEKPCVAPDVVDLCSDSDDDLPLKRKVPKADLHNNHFNFNNATGESTSVSSSGYQSPGGAGAGNNSPQAIISLDSPSPPAPASPPPTTLSPPPTLPPSVSITPVEACGNGRGSPLPAHQASLSRAWSVPPVSPAPSEPSAPITSEPDSFRRFAQ